jgi:site-specific recombinase XerD
MAHAAVGPTFAGVAGASAEPEQLRLFDDQGGVDMAALRMERAALMRSHWSVNTQRAFAADWRDFTAWCAEADRGPLPASPDTLSLYLVHLLRSGRLLSTIQRRVTAIRAQYLAAGMRPPVDDDVRELLLAMRRTCGVAPVHAKAALGVEELRRMLAVCAAGPRGARDRAVLLVGFASGLRWSELAGLDLADVVFDPRGLVLRLARSKTDQEGEGREVGVHRGRHRATCPVRGLEAWLVERGRWPGALFCRLKQRSDVVTHERLSGRAIAEVVQAVASRAGLDASRYGGHSLRAGLATAAVENGAADRAIMAPTGHASASMLGRYVRHGSLFAVDPLAGLL